MAGLVQDKPGRDGERLDSFRAGRPAAGVELAMTGHHSSASVPASRSSNCSARPGSISSALSSFRPTVRCVGAPHRPQPLLVMMLGVGVYPVLERERPDRASTSRLKWRDNPRSTCASTTAATDSKSNAEALSVLRHPGLW
jgi:hypothetical protein